MIEISKLNAELHSYVSVHTVHELLPEPKRQDQLVVIHSQRVLGSQGFFEWLEGRVLGRNQAEHIVDGFVSHN